ncbi:HAMP domain protein [bacterium BMS3Bbin14]|nr:HAMP domain protein [bacterium BMS3Bbin14]
MRTDVIVTSFSLVGVVAVVGIVIFFFLSRLIAKPLDELTAAANRINDGGLDSPVVPRGPREVRELAAALERVRLSSRRK